MGMFFGNVPPGIEEAEEEKIGPKIHGIMTHQPLIHRECWWLGFDYFRFLPSFLSFSFIDSVVG